MLIVQSIKGDNYYVLDTDDSVVDVVSKSELLEILEQGIFIYGVSKFSIENNVEINLILRFCSEDGIQDYDGILLYDYKSDIKYSEYSVQVIDLARENITCLEQVLNIVKSRNKGRSKGVKQDLPEGYEIYSFGEDRLIVKSVIDGELCYCDFYTCLFIYLVEGKSIKGITEITLDYLVYNNTKKYIGVDLLNKLMNSTSNANIVMNWNKDVLEYLDSQNWGSIDYTMNGLDFIRVTNCEFPVYNIKNKIEKIDGASVDSRFDILNGKACSFVNRVLLFDNGSCLDSIEDIASNIEVLNFESEMLEKEVLDYLNTYRTKELMLKGYSKLEDYIKLCSFVGEGTIINISNCKALTLGGTSPCSFRTQFGLIRVTEGIIKLNPLIEAIFLARYTRVGFCWFNFSSNSISCSSIASIESKYNYADNETLRDMWLKANISGISYHENSILPVGVDNIDVRIDGVEITILCLIAGCKGNKELHGYNIVSVPLLFLGSKLKEFDNCFSLDCALQTIYLDSSIVYNLIGNFSEINFLNRWESTRKKNESTMYECLYSRSRGVLAEAIKNF